MKTKRKCDGNCCYNRESKRIYETNGKILLIRIISLLPDLIDFSDV